MKKEEAAKNVKELFKDFAKMLEIAKVSNKYVQAIIKRCDRDDVRSKYVFDIMKVLKKINEGSYKEFTYARGLIPEDKWAFYKMMNFTGHVEQVRLYESIKRFRVDWAKIPVFRKAEHVKKNIKKNAKK